METNLVHLSLPSVRVSSSHIGFRALQRFLLIVAVLFLGFSATKSPATIIIPPTFASLVEKADTIIDGEVTGVSAEYVGPKRLIYTFVTFRIIDAVKGTPQTPYTLRIAGGTLDGVTQSVVGVPKFSVGDRALLFIRRNGAASVPLVGMMLGTYWIETDGSSGELGVLQPDGTPLLDIADIDEAHGKGPTVIHSHKKLARSGGGVGQKPLKLDDFKRAIRSRLK